MTLRRRGTAHALSSRRFPPSLAKKTSAQGGPTGYVPWIRLGKLLLE